MLYAARDIFSRGWAIVSRRRIVLSHADSAENAEIFLGLTQTAQTYTDLAALFHLQRVGCAERIRRMAARAKRLAFCEFCVRQNSAMQATKILKIIKHKLP